MPRILGGRHPTGPEHGRAGGTLAVLYKSIKTGAMQYDERDMEPSRFFWGGGEAVRKVD